MEATSVLRQAYYDKLNSLGLQYPVYNKFVPSEETSSCYILIEEVSSTEDSPKKSLSENTIIQIGIYSKSDVQGNYVNTDDIADIIRPGIYNNERECLLTLPDGYQTWIESKSNRSETINLSPSQIFMNSFLTFTHILITHN